MNNNGAVIKRYTAEIKRAQRINMFQIKKSETRLTGLKIVIERMYNISFTPHNIIPSYHTSVLFSSHWINLFTNTG